MILKLRGTIGMNGRFSLKYPTKEDIKARPSNEKKLEFDCNKGCLFNLGNDPMELLDLSKKASHATIFQKMVARAEELELELLDYERGTRLDADLCCDRAKVNGGFMEPSPAVKPGWQCQKVANFDEPICNTVCGDGIVTGAESCDVGTPEGSACSEVGPDIVTAFESNALKGLHVVSTNSGIKYNNCCAYNYITCAKYDHC